VLEMRLQQINVFYSLYIGALFFFLEKQIIYIFIYKMSKVIFFNYLCYASNRPNPKTKLRRQKGNMFQELKPGNVDFTFILMRDFRENREIHISVLFFWTHRCGQCFWSLPTVHSGNVFRGGCVLKSKWTWANG